MAFLLVLLFIVVPIVELYVIIQVGQAIGLWPTLFLLLLSAVLGAAMLRSQGRAVWRRFNDALAERRVPHREVLDGVLVILGGALLLTPGFLTDIFGAAAADPAVAGPDPQVRLAVLLSPRAGRRASGRLGLPPRPRPPRRSIGRRTSTASGPSASPPPRRARPSRSYDVEGQAHEIKDESLLDPPPPAEPER